MPKTQCACVSFHSTETALAKAYSDLLWAADGGHVSTLCLVDLMVVFDTFNDDL